MSWDDYFGEVERDLRRHGMAEDDVEQAMAEVRTEIDRDDRPPGPRLSPTDRAMWIRHARRPWLWRTLTSAPSAGGTLVCIMAGALVVDDGNWWAFVGVLGVFLLDAYGIMIPFRRWADGLFDPRTGAPVDFRAGARLVLRGIGYVLLLGVVAYQVVH